MKRKVEKIALLLSLALFISGFFVFMGCETDEDSEMIDEATEGFQLLHTEKMENGNQIEFYELDVEPGFIVISETGKVPNVPVLDSTPEMTITDIFEMIRPDTLIPQSLAEAQERQDLLLATGNSEKIEVDLMEDPTIEDTIDTIYIPEAVVLSGGCGASWFEKNVCEKKIWYSYDDYEWFWQDRYTYTRKYLNNINLGFKSGVCVDKGLVLYEVRVRKSSSWSKKFSKNVNHGYWRTYQYWHGNFNNHDFKSEVKEVSSWERYHHCGGAYDV
ncbi:MAG: hypothetical protein GY854_32470 [Deltaproteobacteria bacterium]|nr:hypothetical protein [Deltaproteobacteria bacterium]